MLTACDHNERVMGSGTAREEVREFSDVTRVSVHGEGLLVLAQGNDPSLVISADDNIVSLLRSDVARGVLVLGPEDGVEVDSDAPIVYTLTLPRIEGVETSGATVAEVGPFTSTRVSLRTSGASRAQFESVEAERVDAESSGASSLDATVESSVAHVVISGSSSVSLRGQADEQELSASGASEYRASGLRSRRVHVRASGSSSAEVFAGESIHVEGSGASNVHYQGGGQLSRSLSGAASVDGAAP